VGSFFCFGVHAGLIRCGSRFHSSYKKLTVPVNAKRFPSPPAPLPEFLDLAKNGVSVDRHLFRPKLSGSILRNEYGNHCVYWKIRREWSRYRWGAAVGEGNFLPR
jgi:hypothetical protein